MALCSLSNFCMTRDSRGVITVGLDVPQHLYNVLSEEVLCELQSVVAAIEDDLTARLVLFRSGKESGFLAGADLRAIYAICSRQAAEELSALGQRVFDRLARLPVPTVAAIHGPCLGGGLELALACRYRLAQDDDHARLGLPEVELGLLPAWGGTQRLPQQVGLAAALPMILEARKIDAREAAEIGLVDAAWPPQRFEDGVAQFVSDCLGGPKGTVPFLWRPATKIGAVPTLRPRQPRRGARPGAGSTLQRRRLLRAARRQISPTDETAAARIAVLTAIEQGLEEGYEQGLAKEREALAELLFAPACRNLVASFLQRRRRPSAEHPPIATEANRRVGQAQRAPPESGQIVAAAPAEQENRSIAAACWLDGCWVEGLTIGAVLRQIGTRFGSREAMVFPQAAVRLTWAEVDRAADRVARGLLALGFARGDHLGVWSANWPEWPILQYATARLGVVLVTINPAYREAELRYTLEQSDIRGLALTEQFGATNYFEMLDEICPELATSRPGALRSAAFPRLHSVIRMRGAEHPGMVAWRELEALAANVSPARLAEIEQHLAPGDPINLQYTSGTTGLPKGVLLSHRNLLLNAFFASAGQRLDEHDRMCIPVPLYHCFGCVLGTMCALVRGAAMVFPHEKFDAEATLKAIESERCTSIYGVPTMFIVEMEHPSFTSRVTSSLRTGIMAGSPCPIELMKRVVTTMGAREITIAYGQTEASPLATMTRTDDPIEKRVGTVGHPLPGVEVKIIDRLSGRELPDGQSGELCCRGHNVMLGYYNMPEATAKAIDADGWLHTGDLGLRQPDGYFRITGRLKDTIVRGGENIAPREIEELLYQHAKVEQASVVGVPDRKFGEEILVWIKLRRGETATQQEIRDFCRAHLAHFKTPRYVKFVDAFPTTVTGKIQKYKIRQQAIEELGLQEAAAVETA